MYPDDVRPAPGRGAYVDLFSASNGAVAPVPTPRTVTDRLESILSRLSDAAETTGSIRHRVCGPWPATETPSPKGPPSGLDALLEAIEYRLVRVLDDVQQTNARL